MHYKLLLSAAALVATASAQGLPSLTDLIADTPNLSTLGSILELYPAIAESLAGAENITVFAPANSAFASLNSTGALAEATEADISALLSYHVVSGVIPGDAFSATPVYAVTTLTDEAYTNVTTGQVIIGYLADDSPILETGLGSQASVVTADAEFSGGLVHIIDSVLTIPLSVSATASAGGLSALVGALTAADLVSTLDEAADVTIFAPINAAFEAIGSAAAELTPEALGAILQYHVIEGTVAYASAIEAGEVETLGGGSVTISVEDDGAVFVNAARVVAADILVAGGVVHLIDSVLNPDNATATPEPDSTEPAVQFEGASSAGLAALTSGLPAPSTSISIPVESAVASGFVPADGGVVGSTAAAASPTGGSGSGGMGGGSGGSSESSASASEGKAPMQTAMVGAAALFGGAAFMANL